MRRVSEPKDDRVHDMESPFEVRRERYIKLCLSERVVRINDNPSILTEAGLLSTLSVAHNPKKCNSRSANCYVFKYFAILY